MDIRYRRHDPTEETFLRAAVSVRRSASPQHHDFGDSVTAEMDRISQEFNARRIVSGVAYLAIHTTKTRETVVGYAYGFECRRHLLPLSRGMSNRYVELGGANVIAEEYKGRGIVTRMAYHTLQQFDGSLPLRENDDQAMALLLSGALDDPRGKGEFVASPTNVGEAVQALGQMLGVHSVEQTVTQEQAVIAVQPTLPNLTNGGGALYSTA